MKLKRAFTIVEVLVVIGIIAVLTVIIFPSISNIRAKNRDTERVADIASIQLGLSLYYNQKGEYPQGLSDLGTKYTPSDSLVGPDGEAYLYVPLTKGTKCISYHLGTLLELSSGQIDQANTFSTEDSGSGQPDLLKSNGYKYCGAYTGPGINGIYSSTNLMYNVHP